MGNAVARSNSIPGLSRSSNLHIDERCCSCEVLRAFRSLRPAGRCGTRQLPGSPLGGLWRRLLTHVLASCRIHSFRSQCQLVVPYHASVLCIMQPPAFVSPHSSCVTESVSLSAERAERHRSWSYACHPFNKARC